MPRSGDPARRRLREAALELYGEHGYDATTTAQIAERAGVSERTFFRHFADKREVLFEGEDELLSVMVGALAAPPEDQPLPRVLRALHAAVPLLVFNRPAAERRAGLIAATPALAERAHLKSARLIEVLAAELVASGVSAETARLALRAGMAIFERATASWGGDPTRDLGRLIDAAAAELQGLAAQLGHPSGARRP